MNETPNILWYCTDQQRFDTIRSMGNPNINTPNLDELVRNGVSFSQAYTQCPICTPSRATFLTGKYPSSHRANRNGNDYFPKNETLVTKILAEAGYNCGLIGKLHLSRAEERIEKRPDDGYSTFHWSHHPYPDWPEGHDYEKWLSEEKNVKIRKLYDSLQGSHYGPGVPEKYHQTTWCSEMANKFIEKNKETPWLLSVNPFDPHPPFDPPEKYLNRYDPDDLPLPFLRESDIERQKKFNKVDQQTQKPFNPLEQDPENENSGNKQKFAHSSPPPSSYDPQLLKACYYAEIELIDHQFGRIMDRLEDTGQLENTIVIFMSDHGELLGDHGLLYKGCRFFESLVHVPLIISWLGNFNSDLKSDALVELVDLPKTLLDAAGIEKPNTMQGKSLLPILNGNSDPHYHKPYVTSEYNDALDLPHASHGTMYFDGRYKHIMYHNAGLGELFDLKSDPREFEDLWNEKKKLRKELTAKHFQTIIKTNTPGVPRTGSY